MIAKYRITVDKDHATFALVVLTKKAPDPRQTGKPLVLEASFDSESDDPPESFTRARGRNVGLLADHAIPFTFEAWDEAPPVIIENVQTVSGV